MSCEFSQIRQSPLLLPHTPHPRRHHTYIFIIDCHRAILSFSASAFNTGHHMSASVTSRRTVSVSDTSPPRHALRSAQRHASRHLPSTPRFTLRTAPRLTPPPLHAKLYAPDSITHRAEFRIHRIESRINSKIIYSKPEPNPSNAFESRA